MLLTKPHRILIALCIILSPFLSTAAHSFDYVQSVDKCISANPIKKLKAENRYMLNAALNDFQDELQDELTNINRMLRDREITQRDAQQWKTEARKETRLYLKTFKNEYNFEYKILQKLGNKQLCIYRNFIRRDIYKDPGLLSSVISGSVREITQTLVHKHGAAAFQKAMVLDWWCTAAKQTKKLCYFNF